ncbi:MAG: flagellar protein FliS [Firmicutes bacterium]|nr:flagellar protein FliS [Bacillota bacterium]
MRAYEEKEILDMKPEQLTSLLYKAFLEKLTEAIKFLDEKNYIAVNYLLQDCNEILYRLGAGINYKAGLIADHLEALYNFSAEQLTTANFRKDKNMMIDVKEIISNISEGWDKAVYSNAKEHNIHKNLNSYESHLYYDTGNLDIME